jgi:signal transduction histidine kinase
MAGWYVDKPVWPEMAVWWANDALATVYVVPFAAACVRGAELRTEWGGRWLTLVVLLGAFVGVTALAFGTGGGHWQAGLTATALPFLVWATLRFGPRTTAVALAVYATTIVVCVARRLDPFPDTGSNSCFPFLHLLLAVIAGSAYLLAAVSAERAVAERRALRATRWEGLAALAGGLAHDLNNRLTVVVGSVELASDLLPPSHTARPLLASASVAVDQMARLTTDLLVYAGQGLRSPSLPVDAAAVVRDAAAEVAGAVKVEATPADGAVTVTADPPLFQLAVRHLIVNGVEAVGGGPGGVTVSVAAVPLRAEEVEAGWPIEGRPGRYVRVRVSDTGVGMTPDVVHRMFEPFFTTKFPGRGIGLAVVAGVVRRAGGHIRVASTLGVGTTVELYLPIA